MMWRSADLSQSFLNNIWSIDDSSYWAECERVFSKASYIIAEQWNNIKRDIVKAGECLRL